MTQDIPFLLESDYGPGGDQPQAIQELVKGVEEHKKHQVLLGITGSGKTFTMANVIRELQRPSLVIAHNKTLAAQLFNEFKSCLLYTSPSPRDQRGSRMPSSA